jgi:hypothetical protein
MEPPVPEPEMVTASRRHLSTEYAGGVDRLLWELEKRPMPDGEAVSAVLCAHQAGQPVDALSIGAALVLLQSMRHELDCLEADIFDAALDRGLGHESLAAVLELPDAAAVQSRQKYLNARRELPRAPAPPRPENHASRGEPEAAARAGRRAEHAAGRAASAASRREELRDLPQSPQTRRAAAERAAAHVNEAKFQAAEAAERVAVGLLRAAIALDRCAARHKEWESSDDSSSRGQRAEEYASAARRYREMAASYRNIGKNI